MQSKSVLLVDDDKDDQDFFTEVLGEIANAHLFAVASHGREALDMLQRSRVLPDLIFMDINMPVMNGLDCLASILENPRLRDIPVVILTTSIGQLDLVCKLGAKAFIEKPTNGKTLHDLLEEIISIDFRPAASWASQALHASS